MALTAGRCRMCGTRRAPAPSGKVPTLVVNSRASSHQPKIPTIPAARVVVSHVPGEEDPLIPVEDADGVAIPAANPASSDRKIRVPDQPEEVMLHLYISSI